MLNSVVAIGTIAAVVAAVYAANLAREASASQLNYMKSEQVDRVWIEYLHQYGASISIFSKYKSLSPDDNFLNLTEEEKRQATLVAELAVHLADVAVRADDPRQGAFLARLGMFAGPLCRTPDADGQMGERMDMGTVVSPKVRAEWNSIRAACGDTPLPAGGK